MAYTVEDLERGVDRWGHERGWKCPIPGCSSIPWAEASGMIEHHANRPHERCSCGWIGRTWTKHFRWARRATAIELDNGPHDFAGPVQSC